VPPLLAARWPVHVRHVFVEVMRDVIRASTGMAAEGSRQRDLLPLPLPPTEPHGGCQRLGDLSRGTQQRVTRRHAKEERVAETVWALNALHGADTGVEARGLPSDAQCAALRLVDRCVQRCKPPNAAVPDQEALRELLRSDARYTGGE